MASAPIVSSLEIRDDTAASGQQARSRAPLMFVGLFYILLLPGQFGVRLAGLALPLYRFVLLAGLAYIVAAFVTRRVRLQLPDFGIIAMVLWICASMSVVMDGATAFSGSGAQLIDIGLAYFFARVTIRDSRDLRITLILLAPGLVLIGMDMAVEMALGRPIYQLAASAITGQPPPDVSIRFGLLRSMGPFPHAIGAGMFMGSFLPIYGMSGIRGWPKLAGLLAAVCGFFSISSAAILSLGMGAALIFYHWMTELAAQITWKLLLALTGLILFVAEAGTNSGVLGLVMRFASLNKVTGYYRILILKYGSASVVAHPLFGIGYHEWARPLWMGPSIDNYWLLLAVQYGVFPAIALLLVVGCTLYRMGRNLSPQPVVDRRLMIGVAITIAVFALGLVSVAIWAQPQIWFYSLLGIGVSLANQMPRDQRPRTDYSSADRSVS